MEIRELRIGNIIKPSKPIVIFGRETQRPFEIQNLEDFEYIYNNPENYAPVELTEEWLLKFGFKHEYGIEGSLQKVKGMELGDVSYNGEFKVFLRHGCDSNRSIYVKYVHQLQNLYFALTGEELTIKETADK